ncbi:MAG: hypothetical protein GX923_09225 [Clostridia bacterium]|nr:hypothetical protein [Clostridia bacterium]
MLEDILLGFVLGFLVSGIGYYLVQRPLKEVGQIPMKKIKQKIINRYFIRNFAILAFLFVLFKTTDTVTLVAAAAGLTMTRFLLIAKDRLGKGVN